MGKFAKELRLIAAIAAAIPTMVMLVTVGLWWEIDSRVVMTVYLTAVLVLFVVGILASLRDEMERGKGCERDD